MMLRRKLIYSIVLLLCGLFWKQGLAQHTFEKSFLLAFPNQRANQVAYIQFPAGVPMWGYLEIEITGGYNFQLTRGLVRKRIDIVFNGQSHGFLNQGGHIEIASEPLADQWQIGAFDPNTFRIPIYHLVSSGNDISVNVKGNLVHEIYATQVKAGLTIVPPQEVVGATVKRAYRNLTDSRIGIGTDSPQSRLDVNGDIRAREIKVETANWPDYVFRPNYDLKPLSEVSQFIKENGHLPEVPKASEVEAEGVSLGEMNKILLKKVEELTLHLIEKDKQVLDLQSRVKALEQVKITDVGSNN